MKVSCRPRPPEFDGNHIFAPTHTCSGKGGGPQKPMSVNQKDEGFRPESVGKRELGPPESPEDGRGVTTGVRKE